MVTSSNYNTGILKNNGKYFCNPCSKQQAGELRRYKTFLTFPDLFNKRDYRLLSDFNDYIGDRSKLRYLCLNHKDIGEQKVSVVDFLAGCGCWYCALERQSAKFSKSNLRFTMHYLRDNIKPWKWKSMQASNYKCILTNEKFTVIHHLFSFYRIVKQTFAEVNLPYDDLIDTFTLKEKELLREKCLEIHYRYPLGVCLCERVHRAFHTSYGYDNSTLEQFEEFKQRYFKGEFNGYVSV